MLLPNRRTMQIILLAHHKIRNYVMQSLSKMIMAPTNQVRINSNNLIEVTTNKHLVELQGPCFLQLRRIDDEPVAQTQ